MRNIILNILLIATLISCKNNSKKTISKVVIPKEKTTEVVQLQQSKKPVKEKTAIGKIFQNDISEIPEFKGYKTIHVGHNLVKGNSESNYAGYEVYNIISEVKEITKYVLLSELIDIDKNLHKVIDYIKIDYSKIPDEARFYLSGIEIGQKVDRELFVFATTVESNNTYGFEIDRIIKAWRADKETGKINEISIEGITINMDHWGNEDDDDWD